MTQTQHVGQSIPRLEDARLLTGNGRYVADVSRPGQLYARFIRSQVAHGRLRGVDLEAVRQRPDVVAAYAAADVPGLDQWRLPMRMVAPPGTTVDTSAAQPVLAIDTVRYVGEPVAVVIATDPYAAEDAAEEVWPDIEELPVIVDVDAGLAAPRGIHPDAPQGNLVGLMRFTHGEGLDELFAGADVVIRERLRSHRHAAVPMETRGLLAEYSEGQLVVWGPTKVKHYNRTILAEMLGLPVDSIRFIEPDVGGGFGARGELYPEDIVVPWVALQLGRPVKWIEDRAESLVAMNQSREQTYDFEVAATSTGQLLGFRSRNRCDMGAYLRTNGVVPPWIGALNAAGPYTWKAFESAAELVTTNKTPLGTFRGPGEVESTFARERMLDLLAGRLGMDPLDLRMKNLIPKESLPYEVDVANAGPPMTFESGDYLGQLRALLDHVDYESLRKRVEATADSDDRVGVGLACSISESGHGKYEYARVVPEHDGRFTAFVGTSSVGQGVRTALAQVLADALVLPLEQVEIRHDDTDTVPDGGGAFGDRGTIFGTGAVLLAVDDLKRRARAAVSAQLGVPEGEVEIAGGEARVNGERFALSSLDCTGTARFEKSSPVDYSFTAAVAVVSVNRHSGKVTVERYVGAYDAGRAVNPLILAGQLDGAAAQGIAGALLEQCAYADNGQPLSTSFLDYLLPTCSEMPEIESLIFEFPSKNPLGVKGGGNSGIVATHAALANAVADAIGPAGRLLTGLPLRANAVRSVLRAAENVEAGA
jgi:carbon-monoxide dehydrogenase large subunit